LGGYEMLRGPVGYLLSEEALERGDIRRAAALSASINQPPVGVSYFDWRLRQSRMSVYAGNIDEGVEILKSLTGALNTLSEDETDRLLQVIFDLQALDRHADALPLLERVLELTGPSARQREVLFWIAESLEGSGASEQAALYFLRSATMAGANNMWEQSAQYRAAGALQDAGLIEDARAIYGQLLAVTKDPGRREQLTRKLQDLWLLENKADSDSPSI
jgi:tetratricopeptide (TPR) repeat protein